MQITQILQTTASKFSATNFEIDYCYEVKEENLNLNREKSLVIDNVRNQFWDFVHFGRT